MSAVWIAPGNPQPCRGHGDRASFTLKRCGDGKLERRAEFTNPACRSNPRPMARTAILLAFFLAGACSPSGEGEMRAPDSEPGKAMRVRLTAKAPRAALDRLTKCAGDLVVEIGETSPSDAAYILVVTGRFGAEQRRLAAHTPYPTGAGGRFVIARDECAGADGIEIEAQPIHGRTLPEGLEVPVSVTLPTGKRD